MKAEAFARLARPAGLVPVWSAAAAAAALSEARTTPARFAILIAGLSLAHCGASALGDAFAAPLDALVRPSKPIPSGAVGRWTALGFGFAALALFVALTAAAAPGPPSSRLGAVGAALVLAGLALLDGSSREGHPAAPALLGLCRAVAYSVVALALAGHLASSAALAGAAAGAYAAGRRRALDREDGASLLWPLLLLLLPFGATAPLLGAGIFETALWFFGLAWVALACLRLQRREFPRASAALAAGACLVDALLASSAGVSRLVLAAAACFAVTVLLQRAPTPGVIMENE